MLLERLHNSTSSNTTDPSPSDGSPSSLRLLDLGTCLGQDLRKLLYDGAPPSSLYGSDTFPEFEGLGHALFCDSATFRDHFIPGDIMDLSTNSSPLAKTAGTWDVVSIMMFLHIFDLEKQTLAATNILKLLKPMPGSIVIGANSGSTKTGELPLRGPFAMNKADGTPETTFRHSKETMAEMWKAAAGEVEGKWHVETGYDREYQKRRENLPREESDKHFFPADELVRVVFYVERVP